MSGVASAWALLAAVVIQRLTELPIAARNTAALKSQGAVELGRSHYPAMVAVHTAWLIALAAWVAVTKPPLVLFWTYIYGALFIVRIWVMTSLGRFWTTRIITLPSAPLVRRGPYRFMRHPNYAVVAAEIAVLPLAFRAWALAVVFSIANAVMLSIRLRVEGEALKTRG
jgi:methyltransferase